MSVQARNIRILVEYDGSNYLGWQFQEKGPSIQGTLAEALFKVTGERPILHVAGRTDAGVHAMGQVANFVTQSVVPGRRFALALNFHLPSDISVHRSEEVSMEFHARRSALSKRYRYRVYCAPVEAVFERKIAWQMAERLNIEAMREAASYLLGEHDFESFRSSQCDAEHARREMLEIFISRTPRPPMGETVEILFHADAFCRHMCRIFAGTLVEVGQGRRKPSDMKIILDKCDRRSAGVTAPAAGLTLVEVVYPPNENFLPPTGVSVVV